MQSCNKTEQQSQLQTIRSYINPTSIPLYNTIDFAFINVFNRGVTGLVLTSEQKSELLFYLEKPRS